MKRIERFQANELQKRQIKQLISKILRIRRVQHFH